MSDIETDRVNGVRQLAANLLRAGQGYDPKDYMAALTMATAAFLTNCCKEGHLEEMTTAYCGQLQRAVRDERMRKAATVTQETLNG